MTLNLVLGGHGVLCAAIGLAVFFTVMGQDASAQSSGGGEVRRGLPMNPQGKSRTQLYFEKVADAIEPGFKGEPGKLPLYLEHFKRVALNDSRMMAFEVRAEWDAKKDTVVLVGYAEFQEQLDALRRYLGVLGFQDVVDQTKTMPAESLGELRFGVVTAKNAFLYRDPDAQSETLTQAKQGDPVYLLMPAENGFFLCHGWDGYIGYVNGQEIERVDADTMVKAIPEPDTRMIEPAIASGMSLLGVPYKWGGTTETGVDCSGLMRRSFKEINVLLPRDSDQQAMVGRLTATRQDRGGLRRGDLLFFLNSRGRINHVAIYLGDDKVLESGGPGVRVLSFNPDDPDYDEKRDKRFCFAKRIVE